ncbi:MAG: mechanosensitive ion channel [Nitrospinota bacterium]|nr:mechanosensitive ion channel [Nitrospinota bacterium]
MGIIKKFQIWLVAFLFLSLAGTPLVWAEDPPKKEENQIILKPVDKTHFQLMQITKRRLILQKELKDLEKGVSSNEVLDRIGKVNAELNNLNENYEALATQIPKEEISKGQPEQEDWLAQLYEITRPILKSLKELTERPRKIDNLKAVIVGLKSKIKAYETARKNILALENAELDFPDIFDKDEKKLISSSEIQNKFKEDLSKLKDHYNPEILLVELEEAQRNLIKYQTSDKNLFSLIGEAIAQFMSVRGRNLMVALGFLFGVWWILGLIYKLIESKTHLLNKVNRTTRKLIKAVYYLIIFFIAVSASLLSLYIADDWLLLSLLFLFLFAIGWSFRLFIPNFLKELNLILNLGTVREGERIFYEGIPWLIKKIEFHAILHNPRLEGGIIRVPVGKLIGYSSRSFVKEEKWFPTQLGDWVLLDDAVFGQVVSQTPEQVILSNLQSRRTYITSEFLTLKPRNLSSGYLIVIKFGLDYSIQNKVCDEIPELFQSRLGKIFRDKLECRPPIIKYLKVEFDHAGPSSLDLIILVDVDGSHAAEYYSLKREINKTLVAICNAEGFTIPFSQMTLTMAPNLSATNKLQELDTNT